VRGVPDSLQVSAWIDTETRKPTGFNYVVPVKECIVVFDLLNPGISRVRLVSESAEETFRIVLGDTLSRTDISYLRLCTCCDRLFFAEHGRQQFCSAKCQGKAASQRFRERHRKQLSEKARTHYERKVRAKLGPQHTNIARHRKCKSQPKEV
jgi:hypothetical protein